MAVESRRDLASCHGSIVRIAAAHSWSYRSDNPICTRTLFNYRHGNERDQTDWRPAGRKVDGEHYQPVVNVEYIDSNGATQHNASTRNAGDTTAVWTGRRLQTVHLAAAEENH